jgi:hypothetical protein
LPPVGEGVRPRSAMHVCACARAHASAAQDNRLHRDTPFLCDFRFRTPLPPPPVGAKLLPVAVDRGRMAAYRPYNLWWDRPAEMPLELDLGISLDPLDVEEYRVPPGAVPKLHPADEALLTGGAANELAGPGRARKPKPAVGKAGWLMRTLYLSDTQLPKVRTLRLIPNQTWTPALRCGADARGACELRCDCDATAMRKFEGGIMPPRTPQKRLLKVPPPLRLCGAAELLTHRARAGQRGRERARARAQGAPAGCGGHWRPGRARPRRARGAGCRHRGVLRRRVAPARARHQPEPEGGGGAACAA